jgi:iron complex outermembrane receptor protein
MEYRIENVGEIDNRGWELEGAVQAGPLAVGATATLVDSRVRRTALTYTGDLRAGDRMLQVPRRTVGAFATWRAGGWTTTAQLARASDWISYDRLALARLPVGAPQPIGPLLRAYWLRYPGLTHVHAAVSRDLARGLTLVLTGSNLLDQQRGEPDNLTVLPGRTVTVGLRARF